MSRKKQGPQVVSREILETGSIIGHYEVIALLGQGGYGDIYLVHFLNKTEKYALKCENLKSNKQGLQIEHNFLLSLQDSKCFPRIYDFGKTPQFLYIVMEVLGPSISNTRRQLPHHYFSLSTALRLGIFMIKCLQQFHNHGLVHRDVKPGNFLLRPNYKNPVTLIDFGLSRKFINPETLEPYPERKKCGFRGTSKYASITAHEEHDLCWRDDLISLMYSLVEMIRGKLPWSDRRDLDEVYQYKKIMPPEDLFVDLPPCFLEIWNHLQTLRFADPPDYQMMISLFLSELKEDEIAHPTPFDWENLPEDQMKAFSPYVGLPKASNTVLIDKSSSRSQSACCGSSACLLL